MTTPLFKTPDGVYKEEVSFSTDRSRRFLTGITDENTADMQVSIRGAAFSSDPEHITFEGTTFTIPNPSAHPEGLQLYPGDNVIEVKAILTSGAVSNSGIARVRLSTERDVRAGVIPPSGISVERFDGYVSITVEGLNDANVKGYNFYASSSPGGGLLGYSQINPQAVISGETKETTTELGTLTVDSLVTLGATGSQVADPLYFQVQGSQVDKLGNLVQLDYTQAVEVPETTRQVKTTVLLEDIRQVQTFSFEHDRDSVISSALRPAVPNAEFNTILSMDPLYYVVTALYTIDGDEYESVFSPEVAAYPLTVTPDVRLLPSVTRQQVVENTVLAIYRSEPQVDVKPGSALRDTFIDPFSTEAERVRFLIGFMQAAQSFTTLLVIDDPQETGDSISVSLSPYKQALKQAFFLQSDDDVQAVIDNAFEALASSRGAEDRLTGVRSRGEVTCYTTTRPTTNLPLTLGQKVQGGSQGLRLTSSSELTPTGAGSTYNPSTGRYSVRVFIQAEEEGSAGNLAPGQINTIVNGPAGVSVTNESRTFGGRDLETNRELAARADGILSAVDSGTYRGYTQDAIEVPGVQQVNTVYAGHGLMMRDWNATLKRHTGGKVDVWIRGESLSTMTDTFAFAFHLVKRGQFEPVGEVTNLKFRAANMSVTSANPILEMLDYSAYGYEFKDESTGQVFDLTNVTLVAYDTIQLDSTLNDPTGITITDVFTGSYRFRTGDNHVFTRQPVRSITSMVGDANGSGTVDPSLYALYAGSDPLIKGRSSEAGDYLKVTQPLGTTAATSIPSSTPIAVSGEEHVILEGTEYLNNLGINPLTVKVYNSDRSVEYLGPFASSTPDYTLVDESGEIPLGLLVTNGSQIEEGDTVVVDYSHDENFVVSYKVNSLVGITQSTLNEMRHVTADVLVKEAIPVEVDLTATVVITPRSSTSTVDGLVRTALSRMFGGFSLGQPVRSGDIINVIDAVEGVSYPVVPLNLMAKGDGSLVVRETITTDQAADYALITAWSTSLVDVFIIKDALQSETLDGGGELNETRGVFLDKTAMTNFDAAPNINGVPLKNSVYGSFIIGGAGLYIPGYSDNATLQALYPFADDAEIDEHRKTITAGRVLVALPADQTPSDGDYRVTYVVYSDTGVKNIEPGPVEYLVLGDLEFSWDTDKDFTALVQGRTGA